MALSAGFVCEDTNYAPPGRIADVFYNSTDLFQLMTTTDGMFFFTSTIPPTPSVSNGGLPWTIADPMGAPQVYHTSSQYSIQFPVAVQSGSTIHVFYLLRYTVFQTQTLCHAQFDMTTKTWSAPDETGPSWIYNSASDYELATLTSIGAISGTDFIIGINFFNGTTPGADYERSIFMVRKTAGVWGTPTRVSTLGLESNKDLVVHQSSAIHVEAASDLVHFYWFQNGGALHGGTYNSSEILKSRSYNISANTFNAIQDVVTYDNVAAVTGATTLTPNICPKGVKKSGSVFIAFNPTGMSGAAAPTFAVISGDPTVASPTYTKTDLTALSYTYNTTPRLVLNSDGSLYAVGAYWGTSSGGGYSLATPKIVEYLNTGATTWGAEATVLQLATGTGAYPPTANSIAKPIAEQPYGPNDYTGTDLSHFVTQVKSFSAGMGFDTLTVAPLAANDHKYTVVFPAAWADDIGIDTTLATYYLAVGSAACDPVTITTGTTTVIDGVTNPPGTYEFEAGTDHTISCLEEGDRSDYVSMNLKMVRGDTYKFNASIVLNGTPVDLTGGVVRMTAKWSLSDADIDAVFQVSSATGGIVISSPASGEIAVTIASNLTENLPSRKVELPYDIQFVNSVSEVYTVLYGTLVILPDATITA